MVTNYALSAHYKTLYKLAPSFIFLASSISIFTGHPTPQANGVVCCSHNIFFFSLLGSSASCPLPPPNLLPYCPSQAEEGLQPLPRDVTCPCSPLVLTSAGAFASLPSHLISCLCLSRVKVLEWGNMMDLFFPHSVNSSVLDCPMATIGTQ